MDKSQINPWSWQDAFGFSQAWRIDGAQSIVFEQAENRLWVQLALLALVFGIDPPVAAAAADRTAQAVAPALS